MKKHKCIDCDNLVNYGYVRCKSCAMKHNWKIGLYSRRIITGTNNPNHKEGYFCTNNYCKCGKKISSATAAYGQKRCSTCSHQEDLNGSYIDGRTKKWKQTRNKVFKRDNYTCILCATKGTYLQAHHIIHRKLCENIYDINNLVTLCKDCHGKMTRIEFTIKYLFYKDFFINYIKYEIYA